MHHLGMTYDEVLNTPLIHVSLLVSESTPHYKEAKKKTVTMETYWGTVEAEKKFII